MQTEFAVDGLELSRLDQLAVRDLHRMQRALQLLLLESKETREYSIGTAQAIDGRVQDDKTHHGGKQSQGIGTEQLSLVANYRRVFAYIGQHCIHHLFPLGCRKIAPRWWHTTVIT